MPHFRHKFIHGDSGSPVLAVPDKLLQKGGSQETRSGPSSGPKPPSAGGSQTLSTVASSSSLLTPPTDPHIEDEGTVYLIGMVITGYDEGKDLKNSDTAGVCLIQPTIKALAERIEGASLITDVKLYESKELFSVTSLTATIPPESGLGDSILSTDDEDIPLTV